MGLLDAAKNIGKKIGNSLTTAVDKIVGLRELAIKNIPILEDEIIIEVVGQPGASKQELYYLAMAAASGMSRRIQRLLVLNPAIPPSVSVLMIEYDAADHWVRCILRYQMATCGMNILFTQDGLLDNSVVYRGPRCEVIGGKFDFTDPLLAGVPGTNDPKSPVLPWQGRTILTACPTVNDPSPIPPLTQNPPPPTTPVLPGAKITSPNPKPPGDNRSRGNVVVPAPSNTPNNPNEKCCPKQLNLVELVYAALTDPGSNAETFWDPPTPGPKGS